MPVKCANCEKTVRSHQHAADKPTVFVVLVFHNDFTQARVMVKRESTISMTYAVRQLTPQQPRSTDEHPWKTGSGKE